MEIKIGCRFCVAERMQQVYGIRVDPKEAKALLDYTLRPTALHPRNLDLSNLKDPITQEFLFFSTINKTQFFRDIYMLGMAEKVINGILERKLAGQTGRPGINIWSMGCSKGQEPYSLAMLIRRMGWQESADFNILGTDIVVRNLIFAQEGKNYIIDDIERPLTYPGDREIPREYNAFVRYHGDMIDLRPEVREMVQFRLANILNPRDYDGREDTDLILVNNVFYYFEKETTRQALRLLVPRLSPGGVVISKDLTNELIAESGVPLTRLLLDDSLSLTVNGKVRSFENHQGYRAFQKAA